MAVAVIADSILDIGHQRAVRTITVSAKRIRPDDDGSGVIIPYEHLVEVLPNGSFITPDLDPGPAVVTIANQSYDINVPDGGGTVALWPLIDAYLPAPPTGDQSGWVRNAGGVDRVQWLTEDEYQHLSPQDPNTTYLTF